jgi:hypothetical protein
LLVGVIEVMQHLLFVQILCAVAFIRGRERREQDYRFINFGSGPAEVKFTVLKPAPFLSDECNIYVVVYITQYII